MNAGDIHTLTGAYAVDALPAGERERFERHLAACASCADEVQALSATAARLGAAEHATPPPSLKESVLAEIRRTPQQPAPPHLAVRAAPPGSDDAADEPDEEGTDGGPVATVLPAHPRWYRRVLAPAAAVLLVVVIGLAAVVAVLDSRIDDLERLAGPVADVLTAPDAIALAAEGPGDANVALVASPTRGEGVFLVGGLPQAPDDHVYQLWLLRDGQAEPAGLLEVDDDGRGGHVMTGDMTGVSAVAVTVEPAGGSPQPTTDPITVVELPGS